MRYAKGGLVISAERDIPLLLQVRNSRFVSHAQLFEFMRFGGVDRSRNSFNWRVKRLVQYGPLALRPHGFGAGSPRSPIGPRGCAPLETPGPMTTPLHS